MDTGFVLNSHPGEPIDNFVNIWVVGTIANQREPNALTNWNSLVGRKRGIVMWPKLIGGVATVYDNASKLLDFLNELGYSNWNNKVPLIIDRFHATGNQQFNLDHLNQLGDYIHAIFNTQTKPLLRMNPDTWNAWYEDNPEKCGFLMSKFDLLLAHFGVPRPASVLGYGLPYYWEHPEGYIDHDPDRLWETDAPPPGEEEPPEDPGDDDGSGGEENPLPTGSYKITFHGIDTGYRIEPL